MFLLRDVNPLSFKLLIRIYRESRHHQVRQRAHFLILVSQGVKNKDLKKIFKISHKTMYNWLNRWESEGMLGLYNKPGRGRKQTFDCTQLAQIRDWVKSEPRQLKQAVQKIQQEWDITISTETIKRILKSFSMSWHRMRRGVGGEPDPIEYKEKQAQLSELQRLEDIGEIDLYYLDETGFCLIPSVPYAWQNIGEYLSLKSRRSQRLNVLGIMNRKNNLNAYVSTQTINSDVVSACIDSFFPVVKRPTFIVFDRASIHTSDFIYDRLEEWKERGLHIFELPTYSPELNLIEILWRFIKYEWIEINAYSSWPALVSCVEKILKEFGENYVINFA
jgi:transposase